MQWNRQTLFWFENDGTIETNHLELTENKRSRFLVKRLYAIGLVSSDLLVHIQLEINIKFIILSLHRTVHIRCLILHHKIPSNAMLGV